MNRRGDRRGGDSRRDNKFRKPRRRVRQAWLETLEFLDYKDVGKLRRLVNDRGKILPRRSTGASAAQQRMIAAAIKRAREIALLPFVAE